MFIIDLSNKQWRQTTKKIILMYVRPILQSTSTLENVILITVALFAEK